MQLRKLYYRWRQTRIVGKSGYWPSLKVQIGLAVIAIFLSQALLADAKDQDQKQAEQAQRQDNRNAAKQSRQNNHQAQQQARQDSHQAQQQARSQQVQNQHAQNQANQSQARNQQAQYKAAQDQFKNQAVQNQAQRAAQLQAQQNIRQQNQRDNRNDVRANNDRRFNGGAEHGSNWNADRRRERDRQANKEANDRERTAANNRASERARNEANNRTNERALNQANARNNDRNRNQQANNRPGQYRRWDNGMNNRQRYQAYRKYRNNWNEQRVYLRSNLSRFNELARLNQQQQNLIDSQMRAAYLAYNHNNYNGPYNWSNYSNPQFIDYMHTNNPSLLQRILSMLGLGVEDEYLYSSNWTDERSELTQNMANIHQLAMEGRITRAQEQQLLDQLRPEFMDYHNNNYNGSIGWSQYSDPGFVDYLNRKRPSILMTVRDYLVR